MQKKATAIIAILIASMILAVMPASPVGAVTLTSIDPTSGAVGTEVTVVGVIDTLGGPYQIGFDIDDDGNPFETSPMEIMVTGNAASDSYSVDKTFTVPSCNGSDAGEDHLVGLKDTTTMAYKATPFYVKTSRTISAPRKQEGVDVPINVTVTGGVGITLYNYTVAVTDPAGSTFKHYNFSFTSDPNGRETVAKNYVATFPAGALTNYTGTYNMAANETAPGTITNAMTGSFTIGLTNATEYRRFETVNVTTAGWTTQKLNVTISDPTAVVKSWVNVTATAGTWTDNWVVPWNATMGTYTVEVKNVTGSDKTIHSIQTFTVKSALLTVTITDQPNVPTAVINRTQTASMMFNISYPDGTFYENVTRFSSITVSVYYNTTLVTSKSLTAADYQGGSYHKWKVSWKIPRTAVRGSGYNFTLAVGSIADTDGNTGPSAAVSSNSFTVNAAVLTVMVTQQPAANYTRTETAMAKINITYPDNTFYTDADLGSSSQVRVYANATNVANVTLAAEDFSSTTNQWTISWVSGFNATLGTGYQFIVEANEIMDAANPNKGPASDYTVINTFELLKATLNIASVNTDKASYARGEFVRIFFDAAYADGSPVVTGTSTVTLTAPDGFTTTTVDPVHTSAGRWQVTWWLSEAQQTGNWTVTLNADAVIDGATPTSNDGPATSLTTTFTVLEAVVTLADILAELEALDTRLTDLEATVDAVSTAVAALSSDVTAVSSDVAALNSAVAALDTTITELQSSLATLTATAATTADVEAVSTAVSAVSSAVGALDTAISDLESSLATLTATAATTADVDAVSSDVDALSSAVGALDTAISDLESSLATLSATAATTADVEAVKTDLSGDIGGLNTYVLIAVVLALISAIAAIASVVLIRQKIAG